MNSASDIVCPQIVAAREAAKSNYLQTEPLTITIEPLTNAIIKFSFDFCEKK